MTLESSKISVLLGALDFNPVIGQKTVIVADSAEEVEDVWKVKPATSFLLISLLMSHEVVSCRVERVVFTATY